MCQSKYIHSNLLKEFGCIIVAKTHLEHCHDVVIDLKKMEIFQANSVIIPHLKFNMIQYDDKLDKYLFYNATKEFGKKYGVRFIYNYVGGMNHSDKAHFRYSLFVNHNDFVDNYDII
jgi:hypothetical protein